jgi:prophage regulatory protein
MKIVRKSAAENKVGLSGRHMDRLEAAGQFPKKVRLGANSVGWFEHELDEWLAARAAERDRAA